MYKSHTEVKYLSNSLKHKVLDQDYETIIDITDKTKENHYINSGPIGLSLMVVLSECYL